MGDKKRAIPFDLIFWLCYFIYEWIGVGAMTDNYYVAFIKACINAPLAFVVSSVLIHFLFKKYFLTHKKEIFWPVLIGVSLIFIVLKRCINFYIVYPNFEPHNDGIPLIYFPKLFFEFFSLFFPIFLYGTFYFMKEWYGQRQVLNDLKQEKTAAELELLKSQVQPHFIFNTLNGIYAEAFKKSPETAQQIIKLSNLLEYTLYDAKKEKVTLEDELQYIRNYFDLQKVRMGDKVDISINIFNNINGIYIPPLLLMPIIENCFKHGVNKSIKPSWVRVDITVLNSELTIKIENSIESDTPNNIPQNGGLGLNNVKKRLELLYPNRYDIKTYAEPNSFLVVLKLNIA